MPGSVDFTDPLIIGIIERSLNLLDVKTILESDLNRAKIIDEIVEGIEKKLKYAQSMVIAIVFHSYSGSTASSSAREYIASRGATSKIGRASCRERV